MASWKDYSNLSGMDINTMNIKELRKAVRTLADVANKRLKRFEANRITYGTHEVGDLISGVQKFRTGGLTLNQLRGEYRRVNKFLNAQQSTIKGMAEIMETTLADLREMGKKYDVRKEVKDTLQMKRALTTRKKNFNEEFYAKLSNWRDMWNAYNKLKEMQLIAPSEYDSKQTQRSLYAIVANGDVDFERLEEEQYMAELAKKLNEDVDAKMKGKDDNDSDSGVSGLLIRR